MEKQHVRISVRNLVEFIFRSGDLDNRRSGKSDIEAMQKGSRIHRRIQGRMDSGYRAEQSLVYEVDCGDYEIRIEGRADGIFTIKDISVIDEIKGVYQDVSRMEQPVYVHQAQAMCYAFIYGMHNNQEKMAVQMTYCNLDTEEINRFYIEYTIEDLEKWFWELVEAYRKWTDYQIQWRNIRNGSMKGLEFPFPYREGQQKLVSGVYRTILQGRQLFIQAPTGVGKTMSTVYPSIRAVGEGIGEKIFYLTAKTMTRTVAQEAFHILRNRGLKYKTVTITAKEKLCVCEEMECNPISCPYAKGHFDRVNDAVYELWTSHEEYTREAIEEHALKWEVCPFEMCLDLATWVDGIICDYNYAFDPKVYLQRFFGDSVKEKYIFLIDEAHNLVDRGREMYSATIYKEDVLKVKKQLKPYSKKIERSLEKINRILLEYKRECETYKVLPNAGNLPVAVLNAQGAIEKYLEEHGDFQLPQESLELYFALRQFTNIYELVDDNYEIYTQFENTGEFKIKLFCVNPAHNLQRIMDKGVASVFFSATLLPVDYYKSLLSTRDNDYAMYIKSPFPHSNRMILVSQDVSSRYTRRGYEEYKKIAIYIYNTVTCKRGNYLVFFPSYKFMEEVADIFETMYYRPEEHPLLSGGETMTCLRQKPYMSEREREEFLGAFSKETRQILVGFCVMGGIFSEGIDLIGESLIGALIVGTGIPQISYEREILKNHYDRIGQQGFDYAYRFPGMNKVLQSAGRVIRTDTDRGIILLLDERFLYREYMQLFPVEWELRDTCMLENMRDKIQKFWNKQ